MLTPDLASSERQFERFQREGIALAKLRHPGIVPVYDIRQQGGLTFLIMPFIEGETLRGRLARAGRLAPKEAHRIMLEMCDALGAAHAAGIVHRDIKPDNVILEGTLRKVLLIDFGIAVTRDTASTDEDGIALGTPLYMSPEQITGDAALDARSDLYSLGALAYHLCAGAPPFSAPSPTAVMTMHLHEPPVPLRRRNLSIPGAMAQVIDQCLSKSPRDRPASVNDVARALHSVSFAVPTERPVEAPALITPLSGILMVATLGAIVTSVVGPGWLALLSADEWWLSAIALAGTSALASPAVRALLRDRYPTRALPQRDAAPAVTAPADLPDDAEVTRAATGLFDALPEHIRERFAGIPSLANRLENAIVLLRARLQAAGSSADAAERTELEARLASATAALEMLRGDLMRLTAGAVVPGELTDAVAVAQALNADVSRLIEAERTVEAALARLSTD